MSPYIGQFLLTLAAMVGVAALIVPYSLSALKKTYGIQVFLLFLSFLWLVRCYVVSDFSLLNVLTYSHSQKPLLYKIAGSWANHEGSMLLWVLLMAFFGGWSLCSSSPPKIQKTQIILHHGVTLLFILFLILACDPFEATVGGGEGKDMNPLLEDPLLAIHPPFLYAGYVGFTVPFVQVLSHLLHKIPPSSWIMTLRPMVLFSWTLLSIGLGLGCFWAYYELGWGGWWFWDPVENIALIPWVLGVCLIHALLHQAHEGQTLRWVIALTVLVNIATFSGTFLVRSGLLTSVHSFAVDSTRGTLLFFIVLFITLISLLILYQKEPRQGHHITYDITPLGVVRIAILLSFPLVFTLIFGTLYPLFSPLMGHLVTVGPPYFQMTFVPMSFPLFCFLSLIPWLKGGGSLPFSQKGLSSLIFSGFLSLLLWYGGEVRTIKEIAFSWVSLWIMGGCLVSMKPLNGRKFGIALAHGGVALSLLGMILSSSGEEEHMIPLQVGKTIDVKDMTLKLERIDTIQESTYIAQHASIRVLKKGEIVHTLIPEKRFYWTRQLIHGETAIYSTWLSHLYVSLGEQYANNQWSMKIYYKPYINLLWGGMILIVLAGGIIIFSSRKKLLLIVISPFLWGGHSMAMEAHERLPNLMQEHKSMEMGRKVLCPTCAGQSINDSPSEQAKHMRDFIRQRVVEGKEEQEILHELRNQYGDHVVYQPLLSVKNSILWGGPWAVFLGLIAILYKKRRPSS